MKIFIELNSFYRKLGSEPHLRILEECDHCVEGVRERRWMLLALKGSGQFYCLEINCCFLYIFFIFIKLKYSK